ncbi:MAG: dTDP-4-dehydrorhamnose 3,5-epimerase [Hellea sp.]|nr:dTDP-4-dehydrorhamnose 3,5-epimerase [Hellea sp.]
MNFKKLDLNEVILFEPTKFSDDRGFFMETFRANVFNEVVGSETVFVQENHSLSAQRGTVRGLHFQSPPHGQGKLVRCTRGSIVDVAVDVRKGSPTFGQHVRVELNAFNAQQLWVPVGFLHGFATLEPDTEVLYKVTDYYAAECDGSVLWNDPGLNIDWGVTESKAVLSKKDAVAPSFNSFQSPFNT